MKPVSLLMCAALALAFWTRAEAASPASSPVLPAPQVAAAARVITPTLLVKPKLAQTLSQVREVLVSFDIQHAGKPREAVVEFVAPNGSVFDRREQRLVPTTGDALALDFTLPVGGTLIESARLAGAWAVRLYLDGNLVVTRSFQLAAQPGAGSDTSDQ
jgi:hypothetical protein